MLLKLYFALKYDNLSLQDLNGLSISEIIDETTLKQHHVFG